MKNWMLVYDGEEERVEGTPIVEAETKEEALTLMADALTKDNEVYTYATDGDVIYQSQESDPLNDPDARSFDILEEAEEMKR